MARRAYPTLTLEDRVARRRAVVAGRAVRRSKARAAADAAGRFISVHMAYVWWESGLTRKV